MKRLARRLLLELGAGVIITSAVGGCASWKNSNESIIQVESKQNPDLARRLTLVGVKEFGMGNLEKATQKYIAAISADQTYGPAHNNLGLLHFEDGNLYQAVLAFEQAMEFMPYDPSVYYNLALTLESAGKVTEAMDLYRQAIQMAPANPVFLGNLVRLRIRLGESGPDLNQQLQDLVLIETRPQWRRWADRQLALFFNDALDRGPEAPEFNPNDEPDEAVEFRIEDRVIDLTPKSRPKASEIGDSTELPSSTRLNEPVRSSASPRAAPPPRPTAIPDPFSIETMPPSIEMLPTPH
ncbi:tetratricopeptide repeat protein [Rubripirellula reticaptiva]|uniref:Photosystem I assembly protein Ycf3 n=1 Tax=Rubripirellula reticaptiva TaxID=2528013 RepID=A0A5C6F9N2_9BACT|nr:tetratricopeptide repeat protein [Rubripirellula reticaptiva]TWU58098.1 photosystem I assembly protein Ycf3 [Rubripirellula reticaptiva]